MHDIHFCFVLVRLAIAVGSCLRVKYYSNYKSFPKLKTRTRLKYNTKVKTRPLAPRPPAVESKCRPYAEPLPGYTAIIGWPGCFEGGDYSPF